MKLKHNHFKFVCKHWNKQSYRARGNVSGDDEIKNEKRDENERWKTDWYVNREVKGRETHSRERECQHTLTPPCHERFLYKWARSSYEVRETGLWLGAWVKHHSIKPSKPPVCVWGYMWGMGKKIFEWFLSWLGKVPSAKKSTTIPL